MAGVNNTGPQHGVTGPTNQGPARTEPGREPTSGSTTEELTTNTTSMRRVSFTIHDYNEQDEQRIQGLRQAARYMIYGRETSPTTGRQYIQGYIKFINPRKFCTIKNLLGPKAHIEKARGTDGDNKSYCSKEDPHPYEHQAPRGYRPPSKRRL